MNITYIHHSCFSIETENVVMLFDYYKGHIPLYDTGKHIFVFASHRHQDHFDLKIFDLAKIYPNITFILSKDIHLKEAYKDWKHIPEEDGPPVLSMGKNESITLPVNCAAQGNSGLNSANTGGSSLFVETLASTDEGVAFIIACNGKVIYHAGDLNWWSWEGETKEEYADMTGRFQKEMAKLKAKEIDIAFVPLDPRQEDRFWWGFDYFMKTTHTKLVFPMHFWKDYTVIPKLKNRPEAKEYLDKIADIKEEGQMFQV